MLPKSVLIREVGPREGIQILKKSIPTEVKLELIRLLGETGVREMEIVSFVRPDKVPQMADAEEVVARYHRAEGVRYTGIYLNTKGFERAAASGRLDLSGWLMTAASDTFLRKNSNTSHKEQVQAVPEWLAAFRNAGVRPYGVIVSTAFGCAFEGKQRPERVAEVVSDIVRAVESSGQTLSEICLADTVGWGSPEQVRRTVGAVRERHPAHAIGLHLHDTRGSGLANAYAGMLEGVSIFDSSVAGLGGCPFVPGASGNIVTEDLVYLCEESGVSTGIDLERYLEAARYAEGLADAVPGKLLKAERNTPPSAGE